MSARPDLAQLLVEHPFDDEEPLLHTVDRSTTAGEARRAAGAVANRLRASGVQPGQAVAVQMPSRPDFVTTMFGVWLAGAVFVPLNPRAPDAEVQRALDTVGPALLVRDEDFTVLGGNATHGEAALVQWTSGTSGEPKPILHTHVSYLELIDRVVRPLRAREGAGHRPTPNLVPVPLALNAGLYNLLFGLRVGAAVVVMAHFETAAFAELVRGFGIRATVLPPAAITMLNDDLAVEDLSPLRYVRSITAPLPAEAARHFVERFGVLVLNGYGQAEVGEVIGWTARDAREHPEKIGAVGRPHPGVEIRILGDREVGELAVRPPRIAAGYLGGNGFADRLDPDGFLRTGDLARIDDDGFVWIEGRAQEIVNRGGNKVFPAQVEEVLLLSPAVREAAVVAAPDERLGEVPVAFFCGDADPEDLAALCRDHLVAYKVPVEFRRIDALPRNEIGKLVRRRLVAWLADG